jgi:hypothetical protein
MAQLRDGGKEPLPLILFTWYYVIALVHLFSVFVLCVLCLCACALCVVFTACRSQCTEAPTPVSMLLCTPPYFLNYFLLSSLLNFSYLHYLPLFPHPSLFPTSYPNSTPSSFSSFSSLFILIPIDIRCVPTGHSC